MAENDKNGIETITSATPTGPLAVPKLIRGEDGLMHTVYIDAKTGQPLQTLNGYTILSGNNYYQPPVVTSGDGNKDNSTDKNTKKALGLARESGGDKGPKGEGGKKNTNPMENYGYEHKPGALKYASLLPGALGIAGKVVNTGWNLNNYEASQTARTMLGLPDTGGKGALKGALKDNKGQVSDNASINDKSYHVGFEAMSPDGKTNLTPMEARQRSLTLGGITEPDKVANDPTAEDSSMGSRISKATGVASGWASKALDRLFGLDKKDPSLPDTAPTPTSHPDVASANANTSTSSNGTSGTFSAVAHPNNPSGFEANFGPNRPNMPNQSVIDAAKAAVKETLGPGYTVVGMSGTEDPGKQYGSPRHKTGLAMDTMVKDPAGNFVSKEQMQHVAAQFAYNNPTAGIGYGPGYMKEAEAHLDLTGSANQWGAKNTIANMDPADRAMFDQAREAGKQTQQAVSQGYQATPGFFTGAVPSANPGPSTGFVSQDERSVDKSGTPNNPVGDISPTSHQTIFDKIGPQASLGKQITAQNVQADTGKLTSAQAAAMGFTTRTTAQRQQLATAIAGELSQKSLDALTKNDPAAKMEVANMMTAIENRAASKMFSTLDKALAPSQINSLMPSNMKTTNQNYANNQKALDAAVNDFYAGKITPSAWDKSSYYNPNAADPSWGPQMTDPEQVGAHLFGALPEYGPNKDEAARLDRISKDLSSVDSPSETGARFGGSGLGTPSAGGTNKGSGAYGGGYSTGPGTGSSPGGSAGQSGGAGYSPGGMNSPSGSGFGSPSASGTNSGLGGPTSNNSGNKSSSSKGTSLGSGANTNGQGTASAGSKSRSEGWT